MNPAEIGLAVADAVVATLNDGVLDGAFASYWATSFTAARTWDTSVALDGNTTLRVDVLCSAPVQVKQETSSSWVARVPIDIAVRKQCAETDVAACDVLAKLTGKIWDYLASNGGVPRDLVGYADATMLPSVEQSSEQPVVILAETLHTHNQFTGIIRIDYRVDGA